MAVQQISTKIIKKFDTDDPNFKALPKPKPEEVNGNIVEEDVHIINIKMMRNNAE